MNKESVSTFWDFLKNTTLFLGIFLFFVGWVYLYFFFGNFGLSIYTVKIEIFTYYIYGFTVLLKYGSAIVAFLYLAVFSMIYFIMPRNKACFYLVTLLLLSLFPVYLGFARQYSIEAVKELLNGKSKSSPVFLSFTHPEKKNSDTASLSVSAGYYKADTARFNELVEFMEGYGLKEFFRTDGECYFFVNPNSGASEDLPIVVYIFKKDEISYVIKFIDQQNLLKK